MNRQKDDKFGDREARQRFEAALRAGLSMPAKPHKEMKLGKPRGKPIKRKRRGVSAAT